ncbi:MAG: TRAP transporter small permease [Castellaniella sp.]|uniref:TRAP transporter small permease n=1 Tax=Castellaniella sp. TaxID=1955812 RepID=UPI003A885BD9
MTTVLDAVIARVCEFLVMATTVVLLVLLGANVIVRYALEQGGIEWISEVPAQLFPWMIAAGIVLATQRGSHIAVDFAYKFMGELGGRLLAIVIQVLVALAYGVLFTVAWQVADIVSVERSPLLGIAGSWGYYALMFAAAGTVLSSLTILLRVMLDGKDALPQPNPEESAT